MPVDAMLKVDHKCKLYGAKERLRRARAASTARAGLKRSLWAGDAYRGETAELMRVSDLEQATIDAVLLEMSA